jgi:CRISPR-associated protein Cmr6
MSGKIRLEDLGKHLDLPNQSTESPVPSPKKKVVQQRAGLGSSKPLRVPLQVLKFDDLKLDDFSKTSSSKVFLYKEAFNLQDILLDLLDISSLRERIDDIKVRLTETHDRELKDIFKRLSDNPRGNQKGSPKPWNNNSHQIAIKSEIAKLDDQRIRIVLEQAALADNESLSELYANLARRTESLASNIDDESTGDQVKAVITVEFPWRVRVGGPPGFRERLFPVMHPVYGIPYVPASSIKGLVRSWAQKHIGDKKLIDKLLGYLKGSQASMAAVEFLDAFPTGCSLSADVATPQWAWTSDDKIKYNPAPHQMLSLEGLELKIGLCQTSRNRGTDSVRTALEWLEKALLESGLGSRVSAGYGVARWVNEQDTLEQIQSSQIKCHKFQIWTQGMYGSNPPAKSNHYKGIAEFRPSAIRGVLRYWFRAIALGLYSPSDCRKLEHQLFGTIEPKVLAGSIQVAIYYNADDSEPFYVQGGIRLHSDNVDHLNLMEKVLQLASHLGGVGRGSRRPLHWNKGIGLRGCHWQLDNGQNLSSTLDDWHTFFRELRSAFVKVMQFSSPGLGAPGTDKQRFQDVINRNCKIYIMPDDNLKHPKTVVDWEEEGVQDSVRGIALAVLYKDGFKGESRNGPCNWEVGGKLQVPSYVIIQSNYPQTGKSYQAVTIFGSDNSERKRFAESIEEKGGIKVWPFSS